MGESQQVSPAQLGSVLCRHSTASTTDRERLLKEREKKKKERKGRRGDSLDPVTHTAAAASTLTK